MAVEYRQIEQVRSGPNRPGSPGPRFWPLFRNLTRREARQRYKGSALGIAWTLITPAIMIAAYSLVFSLIFRVDIENYALFLFVGLTVWTFFFGSAQLAATSIINNSGLVTKVSFPRALVPLSTMAGNALTPLAMLIVAFPLCLWLTPGNRATVLALPYLLLALTGFTVGFGLLTSALNVYFRDVEHILAAIGLPWIFLSPVFYSLTVGLPAGLADNETLTTVLHYANPPAPFLLAIQDSLFLGQWPALGDVLYTTVAACISLALGWSVFRRLEPEMAAEL